MLGFSNVRLLTIQTDMNSQYEYKQHEQMISDHKLLPESYLTISAAKQGAPHVLI